MYELGFGGIAFLSKRYSIEKNTSVSLNTFIVYITLLYMNNLIKDGTLYVINNISVSVYLNVTEYFDLKLLLNSTVSNCHIRLEVSHKQKLYKVTGYKYILHFLYK